MTAAGPVHEAISLHGPREVLNELKWRYDCLDDAQITLRHRGAPGDVKVVSGAAVGDLAGWFFTMRDEDGESTIPYHRVLKIHRGGAPVWERRPGHA